MSRNEEIRKGGGAALLLLIAAAALVVALLAIFTDLFEPKDPNAPPPTDISQSDSDPIVPDGTQSPTPYVPPEDGAEGGEGEGDKSEDSDKTDTPDVVDDRPIVRPAVTQPITTTETPYQNNGVYIVGDTGFEMYSYVESLAKRYQDIVNNVAKTLDGAADVYAMAIPLSSGITLPDALFGDIPGSDQAKAETDILSGMGKNVKTVPLHDALYARRNEYIFFRTDHHWTALGAYYAYVEFCEAKGITPHRLSDYEVSQYDGFLGSFYNDAGKPAAMESSPDVVNAFHPVSGDAHMEYGDSENSTLTGGKVIYDESTAPASLKYGAFIMGDNPYTVIENPDITDGSACIVVKESFGNAFVPFLVDHYETVYVIDYRYYGGSVSALAKAKNVDDVLFVNNLSAIRGSYQMGKLAGVQ